MKPKPKKCKGPGCDNTFTPKYSSLEKYCGPSCASLATQAQAKQNRDKKKKRPIRKESTKQAALNRKYSQQRRRYLEKPDNHFCVICRDQNVSRRANTVEHRKGRKGYADDYARDNDIPLLLDERFWLPVCLEHNTELEIVTGKHGRVFFHGPA